MKELENKIMKAVSWEEVEAIFRDMKIEMDRSVIRNLSDVVEKGVEMTDDVIDQIPYMFVIEESKVRVRLSFGKWVVLSKAALSKMKDF